MILTPHLKNLLKQYKTILDDEEFSSFEKEVQRLLRHYTQHISGFEAGVKRGREIHRLIDEQVELSPQIKTSCKKGCGSCCQLEIEITSDDAAILAQSVNFGVSINVERLNEQAQRSRLDEKWARGFVHENRCVFLGDDNACRNYDNRPSVCRKHSVVSPVKECDFLGGSPVPKILPAAEIIMSVVINLSDVSFASLPKMLRSALDYPIGVDLQIEN